MHFKVTYFFWLIFFAVSCKSGDPKTEPAKAPPPVVDVIIAQPQNVSNIIEANGTVVANEFVELHPEVSGRITYLNVPEGKFVNKGTVIARINDADLVAQLGKSQASLLLAEENERRLRQLLDVHGVNQVDYDAAANLVISTKADIEYTKALIDKTVVRAPFSGVAGLRQVSPGAFVGPSDIIATMQQVNNLKLDFTVPEDYSAYITTGSIVLVSLNAETDSLRHTARIIAIEPQANTATRNLKARALLQDNAKANPGAFVKVFIAQGGTKQSILVPTNCIIPSDVTKQLILVKNGNAQFTDITTGVRQQGSVEITSGVAAGDSVVVTGVLFARDKKPVKVRNVETLDSATAQ